MFQWFLHAMHVREHVAVEIHVAIDIFIPFYTLIRRSSSLSQTGKIYQFLQLFPTHTKQVYY